MRLLEEIDDAIRRARTFAEAAARAVSLLRAALPHWEGVGVRDGERPTLEVAGALNAADRLIACAVEELLARARDRLVAGPARGDATRAVHVGESLEEPVRAVGMPVFPQVTHEFGAMADLERFLRDGGPGYIYRRWANPTVRACEEKVASLEGAEAARLFASGMGAISATLLALAEAGDEVIAPTQLYGEALRFVREALPSFGIATRLLEPEALERPEACLSARTKVFYLEPLINPTLRLLDLDAVVAAAHARGALVVADNTVASPANLRPLERGADLVVHSATKFLGGHSDLLAGAACGRAELIGRIDRRRRSLGAVLAPMEAFLLARGLKTYPLRIARHNETALAVARFLEGRPGVARVRYPLLPSHPDRERAARLLRGGGGLVSVDLEGGFERAKRFADALSIWKRATSLGAVESLASLPKISSHYGHTDAELRAAGIDPGTVRLSCGLEDASDLTADLDRALRASA